MDFTPDFSPASVILILFIVAIGCVCASYAAQIALRRATGPNALSPGALNHGALVSPTGHTGAMGSRGMAGGGRLTAEGAAR